jgi:hypothetical protein
MHATPPAPHRGTTLRNVAIALIWAVGVGLLVVALIIWVQQDDSGSASSPQNTEDAFLADDSAFLSPLAHAKNECAAGQLADEDTTLIVDVQGEDVGSGSISFAALSCVLVELDTPSYVISQIDSTRALDGMQSASWETYTAQWTYHPDQGLDITIHQEG